jgi:hypothetical protein
MLKVVASASVLAVFTIAGAQSQAPGTSGDQQHSFIDAQRTRSRLTRVVNVPKVRDQLLQAVAKGYEVQWIAASSSSVNLLLTRGAEPASHLLVAMSSEGAFLKELNEAASQGFRVVVPDGIKAFEESGGFGRQTTWVGVLVKRPGASPVKYSLVKGNREGEQALAAAAATGRTLVAILGRQGMTAANTLLFFEETEHDRVLPTGSGPKEYRIVATARTSAMQDDLSEAAAAGFRVIGAGFGNMTVVMERDRASPMEPVEYQLIAITRVETAINELQTAGAEGFHVVAASENGPEAVFVLHRRPGAPERFEYRLIRLQESTADQALIDAEGDGYRIVRLLNDLILLQRRSHP